jgi:hypothetical protein
MALQACLHALLPSSCDNCKPNKTLSLRVSVTACPAAVHPRRGTPMLWGPVLLTYAQLTLLLPLPQQPELWAEAWLHCEGHPRWG